MGPPVIAHKNPVSFHGFMQVRRVTTLRGSIMDNVWADAQMIGIEVEESEIPVEEFDRLFRCEASTPPEDQ
jgi:hypothetical protein